MITNLEPILSEHPFFHGLKPDYMKLITGCASNVLFHMGDEIFREGEEANTFYMIRQGKVALDLFVPGKGYITIETLREGDVLGWSWLFPPYRWRSNSRAVELTRAIALDGKCLRTKCLDDPAMGFELLQRVAQCLMTRLQTSRMQALDVYGVGKK